MGVQTTDLNKAQRVAKRLEAGMVWVNQWGAMDEAVPFGGVKNSGYGRENGPEGMYAYTRSKSIVISTPDPAQPVEQG
jgi:acyl-CoA reductase-like NAD-dependent aldehyde dehydrogenase